MHASERRQKQQQPQSGVAAAAAALISSAERPSLFSKREGAVLRLVPANERLSPEQLEQQLKQLMAQPHMQSLLDEQLPTHALLSSTSEPGLCCRSLASTQRKQLIC